MLAATMQHAAAPSHAEPAAGSQHPPAACSLQEAATVLGISVNTLRRRIDAGQVRAERVERPQGHVWRVYLNGVEAEQRAEQHAGQHAGSTLHQPPGSMQDQHAATTLPQPADGLMRAEAMASYTRSVLEPLVAALERSQGRVSELEREAGTYAERMAGLERVRDAAMAHAAELEDTLAAAARPPDPTPDPVPAPLPPTPNVAPAARPRRRLPKWRRWLISVVGGGLVPVVVGSSCQPAGSVKHAGMCSSARATLSSMARDASGMEIGQQSFWTLARTVAHTGEKVC